MLRMSRMTDYGTLVLGLMARADDELYTATGLAQRTGLSLATVSKLLKMLARGNLVVSYRGAHGGYRLVRPAVDITAAEVIDALEGPVAITECASEGGHCGLEAICGVGSAWQRINHAIRTALEDISLDELIRIGPGSRLPSFDLTGVGHGR